MPKLDCPLQLSPVFKPKIWGRPSLEPLFAWPANGGEASVEPTNPQRARDEHPLIGEVWITDDRARFINGPVADSTLAEASKKYGAELLGSGWNGSRFPLLAKYIFTSDWLSVQVHPDDEYARLHDPGEFGKCEMWYFVHADRKAAVLLGLKRGADPDTFQVAIKKASSRQLLNSFHPKVGEAAFIPPGVVHALGPGLVLFEVEQNSDLTYRLDDFGRLGLDGKPRPLHLEKGLAVTCIEAPPLRNLPRLSFREPYGRRRYVLACRHFALEELILHRPAAWEAAPERVELFSLLEGEGRVETAAGWIGYHRGETWLIPPAAGRYRFVPAMKTRLLKFYVPDMDEDFRRPLLKRRVPRRTIDQVCFC